MASEELDKLIRDAVACEVEAGLPGLAGLEKKVLARLARPPARRSLMERLWSFLAAREARLGLAIAGAAALLLLGFGIGRLVSPPPGPASGPLPASAANLFALAVPGAKTVALVGDFSAWQPIALSDPDGDGVWVVTLALPPGRYEYAFLVDGRWVGQDPIAAEYVRTFGEYVSVRYVGGEGP